MISHERHNIYKTKSAMSRTNHIHLFMHIKVRTTSQTFFFLSNTHFTNLPGFDFEQGIFYKFLIFRVGEKLKFSYTRLLICLALEINVVFFSKSVSIDFSNNAAKNWHVKQGKID